MLTPEMPLDYWTIFGDSGYSAQCDFYINELGGNKNILLQMNIKKK